MKKAAIVLLLSCALSHAQTLSWKKLAPIPDAEGFAGPFAGVSNNALLVAGGANFPGKKPWEGGTKVWYDTVFALEKPDGEWKRVGKLPRPLGYGVSLTTEDGVLCIGGSDEKGHHREVFVLFYQNGKVVTKSLPDLPLTCANACGAIMGDKVYVAGGIEKPDATEAMNTFWCLDLKKTGEGWQALSPIPGKGRMLSVMGAKDGLYLFGGAALLAAPDGKPQRDWLKEALRFSDGEWVRLPLNMPREAVAAPGPCPVVEDCLWVIGGDDGAQVNVSPSEHRGFPREILGYDRERGLWRNRGEVPFSLVTTVAVPWKNMIVIPGGESKPGIRSTEVWAAELSGD